MEFENIAFRELDVLLQRYIRRTLARTVDLIAAKCAEAGVDGLSVGDNRGRSSKCGSIEPRAADALGIVDWPDEVWTIRGGSRPHGKINGRPGSEAADDVELPATDDEVDRVAGIAHEVFAVTKGQLVQDR